MLRASTHSCEMLGVGSDDKVIGERKGLVLGQMMGLNCYWTMLTLSSWNERKRARATHCIGMQGGTYNQGA